MDKTSIQIVIAELEEEIKENAERIHALDLKLKARLKGFQDGMKHAEILSENSESGCWRNPDWLGHKKTIRRSEDE